MMQRRAAGLTGIKDGKGSYKRADGVGKRKSHRRTAWEYPACLAVRIAGSAGVAWLRFFLYAPTSACTAAKHREHQRKRRRTLSSVRHAPCKSDASSFYYSFVPQSDAQLSSQEDRGSARSISRARFDREVHLVQVYGPVCGTYCRKAYASGLNSALRKFAAPRNDQRKFECISWWLSWLRLEDQMPNEPVIVHRKLDVECIV
eukprot:3662093-Pleurochrysis_carterae.AAC.3